MFTRSRMVYVDGFVKSFLVRSFLPSYQLLHSFPHTQYTRDGEICMALMAQDEIKIFANTFGISWLL